MTQRKHNAAGRRHDRPGRRGGGGALRPALRLPPRQRRPGRGGSRWVRRHAADRPPSRLRPVPRAPQPTPQV